MREKTRQSDPSVAGSGKTDWARLDAMTDEEIDAAALADPDAPPLPPGRRLRRAALAKRIRFGLGLSAEEFSERYHVPLTTLRAWERHETEPDAVAMAFLMAIEGDPEGVASALTSASSRAAE